MALAFDSVSGNNPGTSNDGTWQSTVSSMTFAHVVTGSNTFLVVGTAMYGATLRTVTGITWNTTENFTKVNAITAALESANQNAELWYLDAPSTGTHNIVITLSGTADFAQGFSVSYTGKTVTGVDASATAQNTSSSTSSPTCNVNVNHSDCWQVAYGYSRLAGAPTAGTATTSRRAGPNGHIIGDSNAVVSTGNQTLAFTASSSVTWPGVLSLSFSAANAGGGGGGGTTYPQLERNIRGLNRGVVLGGY